MLAGAVLYLVHENFTGGLTRTSMAPNVPERSTLPLTPVNLAAEAHVTIAKTVLPPASAVSPPPPAAVGSDARTPPSPPPCNSLSCAGRFTAQEPTWAKLSFQPRIDWHAGGVRGDCVAGELEYIMPKYCSPRVPPARNWPSEDRLNQSDVHAANRAQANLADVVELLPNRTILLMGDSVMEQFYNTLQCFLRRESIELPNDVRRVSHPPARPLVASRASGCLAAWFGCVNTSSSLRRLSSPRVRCSDTFRAARAVRRSVFFNG
jgi:hypothetical protein